MSKYTTTVRSLVPFYFFIMVTRELKTPHATPVSIGWCWFGVLHTLLRTLAFIPIEMGIPGRT